MNTVSKTTNEVDDLSDLELLASALQEAMAAHQAGVIVGPFLDEVTLQRAARRARRANMSRLLRTAVPVVTGDAA